MSEAHTLLCKTQSKRQSCDVHDVHLSDTALQDGTGTADRQRTHFSTQRNKKDTEKKCLNFCKNEDEEKYVACFLACTYSHI